MPFGDLDTLPSVLGRVAAAACLAYIALIIVLRVAGKRSLAKLNAFDFAITVAFGSVLATVVAVARLRARLKGWT